MPKKISDMKPSKPTAPEPKFIVVEPKAVARAEVAIAAPAYDEAAALRARVTELEAWVESAIKTATFNFTAASALLKK